MLEAYLQMSRRAHLDGESRDSTGRYFNMLSCQEWEGLCEQVGMAIESVSGRADSTRSQVAWWTFVARKGTEPAGSNKS